MIIRQIFLILLCSFFFQSLSAQSFDGIKTDGSSKNNVNTAVPFLLIAPSAKIGAMGNAGVALLSSDANAPAINMACLAFLPAESGGISLSYSPWLKKIAPNINLSFLSGYYRINSRNTIAGTLRYFSLGNVEFIDNNMQNLGSFNPNELAADLNYARSFGPNFAMGGGIRYIYSNLYSGQFTSGGQAEPASAVALDVSVIYKNDVLVFSKPALLSAGIYVSNIGTKINYGDGDRSYFLPGNFKAGVAAMFPSGNDSHFSLAFDLNKLMAPTEPIYASDGSILKGKNPERSVPSGIFGSFADAPNGFSEELKEIGISTGMEYSFEQKIALRAGYNYQHPEKGNSAYLTVGAGLNYYPLSLDFAYLLGNTDNSPIANTLRFSLQIHFGSNKSN